MASGILSLGFIIIHGKFGYGAQSLTLPTGLWDVVYMRCLLQQYSGYIQRQILRTTEIARLQYEVYFSHTSAIKLPVLSPTFTVLDRLTIEELNRLSFGS